jgi:hypothetical protein
MRYVRDLPADASKEQIEATEEHVRAYLSAATDRGDSPTKYAKEVVVRVGPHPEKDDLMRVSGFVDRDPDARYMDVDFDPFAGIDPALLKEGLPRGSHR